ncbi:hypothetical protein A6V39_01290 [Candidatus Mycoplasma haematobovis]|uniref:Uncharacterized protein n=1 Tax=Candidatus Mycoplasma haematobovis TaxID=432608 RepID=A0A1A9QEL7_9MOLU|nr:hypothetical protein [Candidatus Mycoplasma haematobovis]OAL10688.1 hypothetical protein A6V39_01290 [Candidatus Mycoplasma haematobovis]
MTITTKVGTSAIIASSLAGLGAIGGRQLRQEELSTKQQKTKIIDLITERYDYIILDDTNESNKYWDENWNAYQGDNTGQGKDIFDLDGWTPTDTPGLRKKLKAKCSLLADTFILKSDSQTYENFAKYCARSVTIADQAKKENLRIVNVDSDWNIWTSRDGARRTLRAEIEKLKTNTHGLSGAYEIRGRCKNIISTNKKNTEYEDIFNAYKKICIKQPNER